MFGYVRMISIHCFQANFSGKCYISHWQWLYIKKTGVHQSLQNVSPGEHECLSRVAWQYIERLLRYFKVGDRLNQKEVKSNSNCTRTDEGRLCRLSSCGMLMSSRDLDMSMCPPVLNVAVNGTQSKCESVYIEPFLFHVDHFHDGFSFYRRNQSDSPTLPLHVSPSII